MREIFAVAEVHNVPDPDCVVDHVAGYRGVDWSND
jgi:hypothetical protein